MVKFQAPHASDLDFMAENMAEIDRFEFDVMSRGAPLRSALDTLVSGSTFAKAAYLNGSLVALFGVHRMTILSTHGNPWMCLVNGAAKDREIVREIVKNTASQIDEMSEGFDLLWNLISAENTRSIRWLKWAGFDFDQFDCYIAGHKFLRFQKEL